MWLNSENNRNIMHRKSNFKIAFMHWKMPKF